MTVYNVMEAEEVRRLPAKDQYPEKAVDHYTLKEPGSDNLIPAFDFRALDKPIPKPGETIEGTLGKPDRYDPMRHRIQTNRFAGGGGGGGFRKRDPGESRRIERQHAQHMALLYVQIKNPEEGFDLSDVFKIADAFDRDLNPAPVPESDVPWDETQ